MKKRNKLLILLCLSLILSCTTTTNNNNIYNINDSSSTIVDSSLKDSELISKNENKSDPTIDNTVDNAKKDQMYKYYIFITLILIGLGYYLYRRYTKTK